MSLFNFKIHWGDPKHPTEIRLWTGALGFRLHGVQQPYEHCFTTHEIARWYGISYRRAWFCGFSRFGQSLDYRTTEPPRLGYGAEVGTGLSDLDPITPVAPNLAQGGETP